MLRKLLLGLVFVSVAGCSYPPLAYEENKPQLEDAVITRDLVIFGESPRNETMFTLPETLAAAAKRSV